MMIGAPASAVIMYDYTGNPFNVITYNSPPVGTYTGTDRVTGYFAVDTALAANLALADITGLPGFQFSFNDGRQTVSDSSTGLIINNFKITTDASGDIIRWIIEVGYPAQLVVGAQSASIGTIFSGATIDDRGAIRELLNVNPTQQSLQDVGRIRNAAGSWSVRTDVPLPGTIVLLVAGAACLGAVRSGRRLVS
jgi:hypothetical protein